MNIIQEIEDLKSEFAKKYANNPMAGVLGDGCYETKAKVAKAEQTELAKQQYDKMQEIYLEYVKVLRKNGYEIVMNEYDKSRVLQDLNGKKVWLGGSEKTNRFLKQFSDPCQELNNAHQSIICASVNYNGAFKGLAKGDHGEEYVDQTLELFHGKYKYAKNIKINHEDYKGKTSETDLYVMTSKGILVCEIKNKGNENCQFKISKDGQWSKYDRNGKFIEVMESPFAQNTRHCIATEMMLKANGIQDFKIIPVVIIANEKVRIDNDSDNSVIRISELYNFVEKLNYPEKYNEEYQQKILDLLYANHIEEDNYFDLNVVEEHMQKLTIDYAEYYLQMIRDMMDLCSAICTKEKKLVEQELAKMKIENRKKILVRGVAVAIIDVIAVIMIMVMNEMGSLLFCLVAIGLGIAGFCGTIYGFFYIKEDRPLENSWGREAVEDRIMTDGEY